MPYYLVRENKKPNSLMEPVIFGFLQADGYVHAAKQLKGEIFHLEEKGGREPERFVVYLSKQRKKRKYKKNGTVSLSLPRGIYSCQFIKIERLD